MFYDKDYAVVLNQHGHSSADGGVFKIAPVYTLTTVIQFNGAPLAEEGYVAGNPAAAERDLSGDLSALLHYEDIHGIPVDERRETVEKAAVSLLAKAEIYRQLYFKNQQSVLMHDEAKPSVTMAKTIREAVQTARKRIPEDAFGKLNKALGTVIADYYAI